MTHFDAKSWNEYKGDNKDYRQFRQFDDMMFEGYFEYLGILALNPTWTKDNKDEQRRILYTLWMDPENEKKRYERWYAVKEQRNREIKNIVERKSNIPWKTIKSLQQQIDELKLQQKQVDQLIISE